MSAVGLQIIIKYIVRGHKLWYSGRLSPHLLRCPDVSIQRPPALNTGSLSVCTPLSSPFVQSCSSAPRRHSTTATFFSSCWSPSSRASHKIGRRHPARGSPSPSRHTGTTPCFPYESHIQPCPLLLVLPPPGSWEKEREKGREVRDTELHVRGKDRDAMQERSQSCRHISVHCNLAFPRS